MLTVFLTHEFVQNAFFAGTIVAVLAAVIGYFIVIRAQAFATDSLSHISFAGATGAIVFGFSALVGMFVLSLLSALGIGLLGDRLRGRDVETGMVLSFALGLGVLFLSLYTQGATEATAVLFGSILSVSRQDVLTTLGVGVVTLIALLAMFRPLLFASIDPEVAATRGVPVRLLSTVFLLLLAVTVTVSVQVVGVLLIFALVIAPAAAAERVTRRPLTSLALAIVLALLSVWIGLYLAFSSSWGQLPVSFYISVLAALCYVVASALGKFRAPRRGGMAVQRDTTGPHRHERPEDPYIPVAGH
jgi:zinc/manganese transport system permease protein